MKTIFYSWQSDLPARENKTLIRDALNKAILDLNESITADLPDRDELAIDHDTKDELGTPPLFDTIIKKIKLAKVFVADLTPVATSKDGKPCANPNVMIEYGYAAAEIGDLRLMPVLNEAHGSANDVLPFDLRHKRHPITYNLPEGANKNQLREAREELQKKFSIVLGQYIDQGLFSDELPPTPEPRSSYLGNDQLIGLPDEHTAKSNAMWRGLPHLFVRVVPTGVIDRMSPGNVKDAFDGGILFPPGRDREASYYRDREGYSCASVYSHENAIYTSGIIKLFPDFSIWGMGELMRHDPEESYIPAGYVFGKVKTCLSNIFEFYKKRGIKSPYWITAGISGVFGVPVAHDSFLGVKGQCVNPEVIYEETATAAPNEVEIHILTDRVINKILDDAGVDPY